MNHEVKNGAGSNAASRSFPGSGAAIRPASGLLQVSYELMTPGPTQVAENVRQALSLPCVNPDLDPDFYSFTEGICHDLERFFHTEDHQALILSGEGILGIEAAFASMTEPGDRVLVLDNGVYGRGNADFVSLYGGTPVLYSTDYHAPIDPSALESYLAADHGFAFAALVHCDTPSGMLNDIDALVPILHRYGIPVIVDAVSSAFGMPIDLEKTPADILCLGSQKALSAPPGLSMLLVGPAAWEKMDRRRTPIASFYASLPAMRHYARDQWFPYTMPSADMNGLRQALNNVLSDPGIFLRHGKLAAASRTALREAGLSLYERAGFSDTVSVFLVPDGTTDREILSGMRREGILLAGSFDVLAGKVIRIGHMGENARAEKLQRTFRALQKVLTGLEIPLQADMEQVFLEKLQES